jgi:hypothetical protein
MDNSSRCRHTIPINPLRIGAQVHSGQIISSSSSIQFHFPLRYNRVEVTGKQATSSCFQVPQVCTTILNNPSLPEIRWHHIIF